ncbi:MAG: Methyltransferase protein [Spirosoma sp.]|nr:Methyltransferase protein [Spirosoma sp.]
MNSIHNDWYKNFFTGLNVELWERAATPEWTEQEVVFLTDVLNCSPGSHLLDVPCGFGRHTIALAKRGYHLTSIDLSGEFLQILNDQIRSEKLPIHVIHDNIITKHYDTHFDGAYCLGNSFGYVDYEGMDGFVRNVSAALKPGAHFVINSGVFAESILAHFPKTGQYVLGDLTMDVSNTYVVEDSYMATELTYTKGDHKEKHYFKHFVYTISEVRRLLERHGLSIIAIYNSTEKAPYQLGDQQAYVVAQKQ